MRSHAGAASCTGTSPAAPDDSLQCAADKPLVIPLKHRPLVAAPAPLDPMDLLLEDVLCIGIQNTYKSIKMMTMT